MKGKWSERSLEPISWIIMYLCNPGSKSKPEINPAISVYYFIIRFLDSVLHTTQHTHLRSARLQERCTDAVDQNDVLHSGFGQSLFTFSC